jgi:NADPH:quinone reductase-like Zn-dependent oxidoreductase
MKASYLISYGGSEAVKYGDLPDPVVGNNQLLIQVKAVSINPIDFKIKRGDLKMIAGSKFPKIVGSDFAGIVKEAGPEIKSFQTGDRVYGAVPIIFGKPGALSELINIDPKYARQIPEGMSFNEAASLPVAALTALNGLRKCSITTGKYVLINGATGGVGHFAIQIAKAKGAVVTATCSPANAELAKKLGADEITGYSKDDLAKTGNKFDAILDAYGKMEYEDVCRLLKRKGIYASTLFMPTSVFSSFFVQLVYQKKLTSSNLRSNPEDYEEIEILFNEKKLKPFIENIFTLDKAAEAFEIAENGKPRGKIIIKI